MEKGYSGLTAFQIVQQSAACHPDWSLDMHVDYLVAEEGISEAAAKRAVANGVLLGAIR